MKKTLILLIALPFFTGCINFDFTRPIGLQFRWFENTPVWPLAQAVRDEDTAQIRYWVQEKHLDVNYQTKSKYGTTLLHLAVGNGLLLSTKALLQLGAKIDTWDSLGWRPISLAFYQHAPIRQSKHRLQIMELLLQHGANPNDYKWYKNGDSSKYKTGNIPLASVGGTIDLPSTQLMMRYGAKIDLKVYTHLDDGDSIPYYPVWEHMATEMLNGREESIFVIKYLVVDLHMPMPDTLFYPCYPYETIKTIPTRHYLDDLRQVKLTGRKEKEARKAILEYLQKIGYPKNGSLRLFD